MTSDLATLYPGDLALLLIPVAGRFNGSEGKKGKAPTEKSWNALAMQRYESRSGHAERISMLQGHVDRGQNLGLAIPPGVIVLDADSQESVEWLEQRLPTAPRQNTRSGAHFFCRAPDQLLKAKVKVSVAGAEGVFVDLRTAGHSQVVVEPSIHETGTKYRWVRRLPEDLSSLPDCPQEVVDGYQQGVEAERERDATSNEIKDGTRNEKLFKIGCAIRENSETEEEYVRRLTEVNEALCKPPYPKDEFDPLVKRIAAWTELGDTSSFTWNNLPGIAPADSGSTIKGTVPFRPARSLDDIDGLAVNCWVKGIIPKDSTGFVYGPHSSGKTFWTMRLMAAIADGEPFLGRRTKQGLVFYCCGEGQAGIDRRTRALRLQGYLETDNLLVRSMIPNLLNDNDVSEAIELIRVEAEARSLPVALIAFDTMSRAMPGGDENSGDDTSKAMSSADRIRQAFPGSTALIVAHTGKKESLGVRGHSNQPSNAEFLITIRREGNHQERTSSWRVEKQKDGETTAPEMFELVLVNLGVTDEDGEPISSCVAEPAEGSIERWESDACLGKHAAGCWEVIQGLLGDATDAKTTTREAVDDSLREKVANRKTRWAWVSNGLEKLKQRGFIRESGGLISYAQGEMLL